MTSIPPHALSNHLSYSQVNSFNECGEKFRLERVYGLRGLPGWATVGGSAFHIATEYIDRIFGHHSIDNTQVRDLVFPMDPSTGEDSAAGATAGASRRPPEEHVNKIIETLAELSLLEDRIQVTADSGKDGLPVTCPPLLEAVWNLSFEEAIRQEQARELEPSDPKDWRASGRVSKAWPRKQDRSWWEHHGPLMVAGYARWREQSGWSIAHAGEVPAIEMDVRGEIGNIQVEARFDVLYLDTGGMPILVDKKTSTSEPSSDEQLGLYKVLIDQNGLPPVRYGAFYMAREGNIGSLRDLSHYTERQFEWKFDDAWQRRNAGRFVANPGSSFCRICPLREFCFAVGGARADEIPRPWDAPAPEVKRG